MDDELEVGDCFEQERPTNKDEWIVCVRREPPTQEELKLLEHSRLSTIATGSGARPLKRSHADISSSFTEYDGQHDQYRPQKHQRNERASVARFSHSEQPNASSEVENDGYPSRHPSTFGQPSIHIGEDLQRSRRESNQPLRRLTKHSHLDSEQTSCNTPQSIPAESPTTDYDRVPSVLRDNELLLTEPFPNIDLQARQSLSSVGHPTIGTLGNGWATPTGQRPISPSLGPVSGVPAIHQTAESGRLGISGLGTNNTKLSPHLADAAIKESSSQITGGQAKVTGHEGKLANRKGPTNGTKKTRGNDKSSEIMEQHDLESDSPLPASQAPRTNKNGSTPGDGLLSASITGLIASPGTSPKQTTRLADGKVKKQAPSKTPATPNVKQESQKNIHERQESLQNGQVKRRAEETSLEKTPTKKVDLAKLISSEQEAIQKLSYGLTKTPRQNKTLTPHIPGRTPSRKRSGSKPASLTPSRNRPSSVNRNGLIQTPAGLASESERQPEPVSKKSKAILAQQSSRTNESASVRISDKPGMAPSSPKLSVIKDTPTKRKALHADEKSNPASTQAVGNQQDRSESISRRRSPTHAVNSGKVETDPPSGRQSKANRKEPSQEAESAQVNRSSGPVKNDSHGRDNSGTAILTRHAPSGSNGNDVGSDPKTPRKGDADKSQTLVPTSPIPPQAERRNSASTSYSRSPARLVTKTPDSASASASDSDDSTDASSNSESSSESGSHSGSSDDSESEDEETSKKGSGAESGTSSGAEESDDETAKAKVKPTKNNKPREATNDTPTSPDSPSRIDAQQAESQLQFESSAPLYCSGPGMSQLVSQNLGTQSTQTPISKPSGPRPNHLSQSKYPSLSQMKNSSQNSVPVAQSRLPSHNMPINQKRPSVSSGPSESSSEEESSSDDEDLDSSKIPNSAEEKLGSSQRSAGKNRSAFMGLLKRKCALQQGRYWLVCVLIRHIDSQKSKGR